MKGAFKSNANESKLRSIHSKIQSYRNQMSDLRFEKLLKVRSILTAEQRAKFDELKAQMKEKRRGEKRMRREH
jgi:Spy/CpxP family protein refolding chaperone